jgi:hypothetical protein
MTDNSESTWLKNPLFAEVLCHNCAAKPVSAVKTDFIDDSLLLILRNLLKAKDGPEIPAYMARPPFSTADKRQEFGMDSGCARKRTYK